MTKPKRESLKTFNIEVHGKGKPKKYSVKGLKAEEYAITEFAVVFKVISHEKAVTFSTVLNTEAILYYTVVEPGMSHVYSFAFTSLFFLQALRFFNSPRIPGLMGLFVLLALICLIRPVNVLKP